MMSRSRFWWRPTRRTISPKCTCGDWIGVMRFITAETKSLAEVISRVGEFVSAPRAEITASWRQRWVWWKEFRQLGAEDVCKRVEHSIWGEEKMRAARR